MKKSESTIKCKSCRQNIAANKMFLHEGFCQKNNIFCEHCEKVFMWKDYDNHILEISKNLTKKNRETIIKRLVTDFKGFKSDITDNNINYNINYNNINYNNNTIDNSIKENHYRKKVIKVPIIEEYKIRKPIEIDSNGNIIKSKNSDSLLSLINFDFIKKIRQNTQKYSLIFNTDYNFDYSNNSINYENINYYNNRRIKKRNYLQHVSFLNNNNIFNEKNSILIYEKNKEKKNNLTINILDNNHLENKLNTINIDKTFDNYDLNNKIRNKSNDINIGNAQYRRHTGHQINKNNIIINNHIITYNTNNNINEIQNNQDKNFFLDRNTGNNKYNINEKAIYNTKTANYLDRYRKYKDKNIINNKGDYSNKIPLDRTSSNKYKRNNIKIFEKKPENRIRKQNKYSSINKDNRNLSHDMKKCPFCNVFTDNLTFHNNFCKKGLETKNPITPVNSIKKIQKPKNRETIKLEFYNKKEDIVASSPEEKNIIMIKSIKPTSRIKYSQKLPLKKAIIQRGKSQEITLTKKKKKKKHLILTKSKLSLAKVIPSPTPKITNNIPYQKNENRLKQLIKNQGKRKNVKTNVRKRKGKFINISKQIINKTFSPDNKYNF